MTPEAGLVKQIPRNSFEGGAGVGLALAPAADDNSGIYVILAQ